ncbi:helix-turn-helix domain-containing protein [Mitsuokella sp. WILCCON 0060]|uniref:helix-turn-helix domain-containing protein n=1 Tax=unclassified Mitsuokella TaxID=2637239 RepID=UPI003F0CA1C9
MKDYLHHYGLKVHIYPSDQQKKIIQRNADAARFVYNEMVAVNQEISRFGKHNICIDFIEQRVRELRDSIHSLTTLNMIG